jgi:hypothetical protein
MPAIAINAMQYNTLLILMIVLCFVIFVKSFLHIPQAIIIYAFYLPVAAVDAINGENCSENISQCEPRLSIPLKEIDKQQIRHA